MTEGVTKCKLLVRTVMCLTILWLYGRSNIHSVCCAAITLRCAVSLWRIRAQVLIMVTLSHTCTSISDLVFNSPGWATGVGQAQGVDADRAESGPGRLVHHLLHVVSSTDALTAWYMTSLIYILQGSVLFFSRTCCPEKIRTNLPRVNQKLYICWNIQTSVHCVAKCAVKKSEEYWPSMDHGAIRK